MRKAARITDAPPEYVSRFRTDGVVTYVNESYCHLVGRPREDILGLNLFTPEQLPPWFPRIHPDDMPLVQQLIESLGPHKTVGVIENRLILAGGSVRWTRWVNMVVMNNDGTLGYYQSVGRDISDEHNMDQDIVEAVDRERQQIGKDMHDGLGQVLAGTAYMVASMERKLKLSYNELAPKAQDIAQQIARAQEQLTRIISGLHPVDLSAEELPLALQQLAKDTSEYFHMRCHCRATGTTRLSSNSAAAHVYHIAQEATTNAIKHAEATTIHIRIHLGKTNVSLTVTDDGIGIRNTTQRPSGMGLRIMEHRARILGGELSVGCRDGDRTGTRVTLRFKPAAPAVTSPTPHG